jgi:flavin reductase (DIM6/NTAB) family NADH-FMN oxidoreductase RutF
VEDLDAFDRAMSSNDPAMVIVTTAVRGRRAGCLVGFHAQCSIEPRRYVVWLSKANHTYGVALAAERFAVHHLVRGDRDLAELFGGTSGHDVDKFERCAWTDDGRGVPLLARCPNRFTARRVALLEEGSDHACIVVEPDRAEGGGFVPLRLGELSGISPGHAAEDRQVLTPERA